MVKSVQIANAPGCGLRVVHVGTTTGGGAGRAMARLHEALGPAGVDSTVFVARNDAETPGAIAGAPIARATATLRRHLCNRPRSMEFFSDDRNPLGRDLSAALPAADIIHLHWVARLIDYQTFFPAVSGRARLVWTLHDMNPFTGGCHYADGCDRFLNRCGACPQLLSASATDLSRSIWRRKHDAYSAISPDSMRIVAPSRWLAAEARRSRLLDRFEIKTIPYGLNTRIFAPRDRAAVRRKLGVPADAHVVLFVAASLDNHRKGFDALSAALTSFAEDHPRSEKAIHLLTMGDRPPPLSLPFCQQHLGPIVDDERLAEVYSAADVFVIPSREDNLPNTVLESLACGTPVVGFDVGGIPDMVRPGETGLLAAPGDIVELAAAIARVLGDADLRARMSAAARRIAVAEYDESVQARRYASLYAELVGPRESRQPRVMVGARQPC